MKAYTYMFNNLLVGPKYINVMGENMRTSEEYVSDLEKMRGNVYMGGELVKRADPRIRPGINVMSVAFDLAQNSDYEGLMTASSHLTGEKINRFTHIPQTIDEEAERYGKTGHNS